MGMANSSQVWQGVSDFRERMSSMSENGNVDATIYGPEINGG